MSSLAERVWSTLIERKKAERLDEGIIELEHLADDKMLLLTEWLADQAELLYFGEKR